MIERDVINGWAARKFSTGLLVAAGVLLSATSALAGPIYLFTTSEGSQPSTVGTITLTQVNSKTVDVSVDLSDTTLPAPRYGFVNTGNKTPFAFTVNGTETGLTALFNPQLGTLFSLSMTDGPNPPYGIFGVSINYSGGNGSGSAYYGDLEFQLTRASGLSTDDFITNAAIASNGNGNSGPAYFSADLTNGSGTGAQAWNIRGVVNTVNAVNDVPEPMSLALLGAGLLGIVLVRRPKI